MNCEDLNINMFDLLEGKLDSNTQKEFREHIDLCEKCKTQYLFIEGAITEIDTDKRVDLASDFADRVLLEAEGVKSYQFSLRRMLAPLAAAAVIIFGIITGLFISDFAREDSTDIYADLSDGYYYTNEIHLETIESFFLINED